MIVNQMTMLYSQNNAAKNLRRSNLNLRRSNFLHAYQGDVGADIDLRGPSVIKVALSDQSTHGPLEGEI